MYLLIERDWCVFVKCSDYNTVLNTVVFESSHHTDTLVSYINVYKRDYRISETD